MIYLLDSRPRSYPCLSLPPTEFLAVDRKGELSPAGVDRGWPHQVALPAAVSFNGGYNVIQAFCEDFSICKRGHSVFHDDQWWNVYCFADAEHAEKFMRQFGGEKFDPRQQ